MAVKIKQGGQWVTIATNNSGGKVGITTTRVLGYTTSSQHTFHPDLLYAKVYMLGGGGTGGGSDHVQSGSGGKGGPGALAYRIYTAAEAGTTATYTIGGSAGNSTFESDNGTTNGTVLTAGAGTNGGTGTYTGGGATLVPVTGADGAQGYGTNSFLDQAGGVAFGYLYGYGGTGTPAGSGPTGSGAVGGQGGMYIEEYYSLGGSGGSDGGVPIGTVVIWSGTIASLSSLSGWVLCDGQTSYTNILGNTATVPDLRDKFVVGATGDTTDTTYPGLSPGADGGSADATIASHTHWIATSAVTSGDDVDSNLNQHLVQSSTTGTYDLKGTAAGNIPNVGKTSSAGSSSTNTNLPPYYALAYIIRVS